MADPFSTVVHKLSRRDSTSLLIALFLGYALASCALAAATGGYLRWLLGGMGAISFLTALAAFGYAYLVKPERLRTEELARMDMVLDWITRADVDDEHRTAAARLLPIVLESKESKSLATKAAEEEHD